MRQSKTSNGVTTNHYYDGQNVVIDETNGSFTKYNRGLGLLSRTNQNGTQYYHFNIHGDTSALTDSNGEIVLDYRYDAFGNQLKSNENDTNPFRYNGEYFDEETGFVYLRNRYYDPSIGRFITEDPHWNVNNMIYGDEEKTKKQNVAIPEIESIRQASNLFVYCGNNPVMFIDSTGKYNRKLAVEWAVFWAENARLYPGRFKNDCTNFISNVLYYGGELEQGNDWYFNGGLQIGDTFVSRLTSYSKTWAFASDQYKWISNPKNGYINGNVVCIHESKWISNAIKEYNIQPGDLIYWDKGNGVYHASMIVSVKNGNITYAQHTSDKSNGNLKEVLDENPNYYAYIVRIKDDAK